MKAEKNGRGFVVVTHRVSDSAAESRLLQESSAIGNYPDSFQIPGSSALWIGEDHHLNREEVADLIRRMQHWLDHKRLPLD